MPMPSWFGHINKRIFNPMELRKGQRPVLRHLGRSTGKTYRTPLDAHAVDGGFLFILVYGPGSDWVRNALAAGSAVLELDGRDIPLDTPRLIPMTEALPMLPADVKRPPTALRISQSLLMHRSR